MDDDGWVSGEAFVPDTRWPRENGDLETSINWEDDATVEARTLADANGRHGAARLSLSDLAHEIRRERTSSAFFAERTKKPGNDYHGDIVFRSKLRVPQRKMIASALALNCVFVPPPQRGAGER